MHPHRFSRVASETNDRLVPYQWLANSFQTQLAHYFSFLPTVRLNGSRHFYFCAHTSINDDGNLMAKYHPRPRKAASTSLNGHSNSSNENTFDGTVILPSLIASSTLSSLWFLLKEPLRANIPE